MLKVLIIIFFCILAIIDIIAITGPKIKKHLEAKKIKQKRKEFGERMKKLEIK